MSIKLIPINFKGYELPKFKESKKGDWFEYGSERPYRNCYGDYLVKLLNESSKQSTIIDAKTKFIVGKGFIIDGNTTFTERAMIEGFLRTPGEDGNMEDLLCKVVKDKKVFGGFALQIRVNSNGKIAAVDHLEFNDVRVGIEEGEYFYTSDWKARNPQDNEDFAKLKLFSFDNELDTETNYIIYYKEYRPDLGEYPMPDYIAAIPYLEADSEIANFTLQNIKNNLTAGYIISFNNGQPSEEEMEDIEYRFKDYATGTDNAGKPLLSFTDQNSDHPSILPIPVNGQDERFINLNTQITQEIYTAHGVTSPMLFGIKDQTGLGNNADELRTAAELYQNIHIDGEQQILEELFNEIINYNGLPKVLKIQKLEAVTKQLSEATIVSAMTQEELREKIGLPPSEVESNKVAEAIGLLSPLVATKVLDNMSAEEIRELIGLKGDFVRRTETLKKVFKDADNELDDMMFAQLESMGFDENDFEVLETKHNEITCFADAERFEQQLLMKHNFALERVLSDAEKAVLSMLVETPTMPNVEIAEAMEISIQETNEIIQELQNIGALDVNFKPTKSGKTSIQKPTEEIFVVYKYIKRPDALPLKTESRRFCKQMVSLAKAGRLYSLDQLKLLRNDFNQSGIDIFTKRGGWYTLPGTDISRPFCRHIWEQQVIRKKR
jgi:hypothetical protein